MGPTQLEALEMRIEQLEKTVEDSESYTHWVNEKLDSHLHHYHHDGKIRDDLVVLENCPDCALDGIDPLPWAELF